MITISVKSNLRKRLLGQGNVYFYHGAGKESQTWHWAEGKNTERKIGGVTYGQKEGSLGVLQQWQNKLAVLLDNYLTAMSNTAKQIFEREWFFSIKYQQGKGGKEYGYNTREDGKETMNMAKTEPISQHFFSHLNKHGKVIRGEFGNDSDHAIYVEWGTGPVGKANKQNLPRAMKERRGTPTYRTTPWTYFNNAVGHFVSTRGMPPRPFVYPAFLRLRSAFVNDCKAVLRGLDSAYFLQSAALEPY